MDNNRQMIPLSDVQVLATAVARSNLFPAFKTPEQALVLMMMAQVEGCHPMQAVQRYDVIQGKPAKKSDAMLADFQQRGGTITWIEYTDEAVEAEFMSKGMAKPARVKWTYKQAEAAGLTSKQTWKQFKRQMLKARVISEGIRISDPGVVAGLYSPEEVQDFDGRSPAQAVQEAPTSQAADAEVVQSEQQADDADAKKRKVRALVMAIKEAGIPESERKAWMSVKLNKQVESSKDLSVAELDQLIADAKATKVAA